MVWWTIPLVLSAAIPAGILAWEKWMDDPEVYVNQPSAPTYISDGGVGLGSIAGIGKGIGSILLIGAGLYYFTKK